MASGKRPRYARPIMRVLITGGAGFIGVNAAKTFLEKGWSVTALDNLSRRGTEINKAFLDDLQNSNYRYVQGDVRTDRDLLAAEAAKHDVILHLAAQVAVTTSVTDPRTDFDCNALGTFNVLEAARAAATKPAVLYASTNKVYGSLEGAKVEADDVRYRFADGRRGVTEEEPLDFHSPYGCSKGAADQYVRDYARIYNMKTVVFRQSCIYGQHQLGIEDQGWVAWFIIAAMFGKPITVYGDGKQVRDLLHVDDLVAAYVKAIENIDAVSGQVFNTGGGADNALGIGEFLRMLEKKIPFQVPLKSADWRAGDQPIFISDNSKLETMLGWKPQVGVQEGIERLMQWLTEKRPVLEKFYQQ